MDPLEAIRLCLRRGIKNVSFTPAARNGGTSVSIYPFGGDPAVKAEQKQLRKMLAEQRRLRSERLALQTKIRTLERTQGPRR